MTFDYARARATADRLLANFGATGAIRRETPGSGPAYNPGDPTVTDYPVTLALTSYNARQVDGTRIRAEDRKALVSASAAVVPTTSDLLIAADGAILKIVDVKSISPAGTTVLYECQVRR